MKVKKEAFPTEEFQQLLRRHGITQTQIAKSLGVKQGQVSKVIWGHRPQEFIRLFVDKIMVDLKTGKFTSLDAYEYQPPKQIPAKFIRRSKSGQREQPFSTTEFKTALLFHHVKQADIARKLRCGKTAVGKLINNTSGKHTSRRISDFLELIFHDMKAGRFTSLEDYEA